MIVKGAVTKTGRIQVTFELPSTLWAERVNLVGEFNDWDTRSLPMARNRSDANWRITIELEPGRQYRFRYLIDGKQWHNDWHADNYVENPFGSDDSVLILPPLDAEHQQAKPADAEATAS